MEIRKAKLKDIPQIVNFAVKLIKYHANFDPFYTPAKNVEEVYSKFFKRCVYSTNRFLLVAEKNSKIVGYALGELGRRPPVFQLRKIGLISDVFVDEGVRKKGIAKLFLAKLFDWFRSKKLNHVELSVHVKNEMGQKAWLKCGFKSYMSKQRLVIKSAGG